MPSGYTCRIAEGKMSFEEFALDCARAFGALVSMRDEPSDAKIPDKFVPDSYHADRAKDYRRELNRVRDMTDAKAEVEAGKEYHERCVAHTKAIDKARDLHSKYSAMVASVLAWQPPTPEHQGLKDFMLEQLASSIEFDCNTDYYVRNKPKPLSGSEWRAIQIDNLEPSLAYDLKAEEQERLRCHERTAWVRALRDSLAKPTRKKSRCRSK